MKNNNKIIPLIAYADKLSVRPREKISFKVSSTIGKPFDAWLMRSISADPNPEGPGIIEESVEEVFTQQTFPSRYQSFSPGSYAVSKNSMVLFLTKGFKIRTRIFPTLHKPSDQTIFNIGALSIFLNKEGALALRFGNLLITPNISLELRKWYQIQASFNVKTSQLSIQHIALSYKEDKVTQASINYDLPTETLQSIVCIAAELSDDGPYNHFNGKIESTSLYQCENLETDRLLAAWDFSYDISTNTVKETANDLDLELINLPTRAVTGSNWDASEMCW